jgi:AcrR family transcriptional regulator
MTARHTKDDVVRAASRLFAEKGYHATSMRDLGRELGLLGSSLYSHVAGKQDLLVEIVETGAALFQTSAAEALAHEGPPEAQLRAFIEGHLDVIVVHLDEARTFLNEARSLEPPFRQRIVAARDRYEAVLRGLLADGVASGDFRPDLDPRTTGIYILSVLNAIDRWYRADGELDRNALADSLVDFIRAGISAA